MSFTFDYSCGELSLKHAEGPQVHYLIDSNNSYSLSKRKANIFTNELIFEKIKIYDKYQSFF